MTDFLPRFAAALAPGACLLAATASANADARYPARPLRMVVPYAAGGPTDTFARALAESWARQLGVSVLVDNRSGAGTVVGTEVVAKAVPDGYTMLMTTVAHAANQRIYAKLPYRTVEDFSALCLAAPRPPLGGGGSLGGCGRGRARPAGGAGQQVGSGSDTAGLHCLPPNPPGQGELRLGGCRQRSAPGGRTAQPHGRHICRPCAVSRQRASAGRLDRRACRIHA